VSSAGRRRGDAVPQPGLALPCSGAERPRGEKAGRSPGPARRWAGRPGSSPSAFSSALRTPVEKKKRPIDRRNARFLAVSGQAGTASSPVSERKGTFRSSLAVGRPVRCAAVPRRFHLYRSETAPTASPRSVSSLRALGIFVPIFSTRIILEESFLRDRSISGG